MQAVYQSTHPILFIEHAVYMVVWSPRSDHSATMKHIERLLHSVHLRAPEAPVVLVQTHADTSLAAVLVDMAALRLVHSKVRRGTGVSTGRWAVWWVMK